MTSLRSSGWSVRPAFVESAPSSPLVLWADEAGLTQLAGDPPVAWQTPWEFIGRLRLDRGRRSMSLEATVAGVRYTWRKSSLDDYDAWRGVVEANGGAVARRRPRAAVLLTVVAVLVAAASGALAAALTNAPVNAELTGAKHANLTIKDLPTGWYQSSSSLLRYLVPSGVQHYTGTTTTMPSTSSLIYRVARQFETCLGVSYQADRVYGAAGQLPTYQASSPVYATSDFGGAEVASTAQYYSSTSMVTRDVKEMSKDNFGSCLAESSATLLLGASGVTATSNAVATNWSPTTFLHGWVRGGVIALPSLGQGGSVHLVEAVIASGHYELTLTALVGQWPDASSTLSSFANTMLSRITESSATAA